MRIIAALGLMVIWYFALDAITTWPMAGVVIVAVIAAAVCSVIDLIFILIISGLDSDS